jgi:acetoin utilization deacetylase AcuC-like enzyme
MSRYPLLNQHLLVQGIIKPTDIMQPELLSLASAALVHTPEYLGKLQTSGLTPAEARRLGLPWSKELLQRARAAAGGTLLAARMALRDGMAANLAGGSHHAFADHGEACCVINDVAIAVCQLRIDGMIERAAIVDLDVRQGNGTAAIFESDDEVFTFSMHAARNYPAEKMRSNLDVPLNDGVGDQEYLDLLELHLPQVMDRADPNVVFYVAGVNVAADDRCGKLALSDQGIRLRDRMVIAAVRRRKVPLVIVMAGDCAPIRSRSAELHSLLFGEAVAYER